MSVWDAAKEGDIEELVRLIQPRGNGDVNEIGGHAESTPLIIATMFKRFDCVRVLLGHGADVNAEDKDGCSALYWLLCEHPKNPEDFMEVVHMMLEMGANPSLMASNGWSLMYLAIEKNMENVVRLLVQYGANPSAICCFYENDVLGWGCSDTPLHESIRSGNISMVKILIKLKADLNITTGDTPLIDAIKYWTPSGLENSEDLVRLLLDNGAAIDDNGAGSHLPEWTEELEWSGQYKQRTTVQSLAALAIRKGKPIVAAILLAETERRNCL
jgi:hypothetical protein